MYYTKRVWEVKERGRRVITLAVIKVPKKILFTFYIKCMVKLIYVFVFMVNFLEHHRWGPTNFWTYRPKLLVPSLYMHRWMAGWMDR